MALMVIGAYFMARHFLLNGMRRSQESKEAARHREVYVVPDSEAKDRRLPSEDQFPASAAKDELAKRKVRPHYAWGIGRILEIKLRVSEPERRHPRNPRRTQ